MATEYLPNSFGEKAFIRFNDEEYNGEALMMAMLMRAKGSARTEEETASVAKLMKDANLED